MVRFKAQSRRKPRRPTRVMIVKAKRRKRKGIKISKGLLHKKLIVKMTYADTITIDAGAAAISNHVYRAVSIFDPDQTGGGHQPLLHDEYQNYYANYRVLRCKIKVTPVNSLESGSAPGFWGVFLDPDTTLGYSSSTQAIEDKTRTKSWSQYANSTLNPQVKQRSMTRTFNAKRFLGPEEYNDVTPFGGSPGAAQAYFQIWSGSVLGNNPGAASFLVELEYTVELSGQETITPS